MNWEDTLIKPDGSIETSMQIIDKTSSRAALVVDSDRKLLGIVTDGDVRRAILRRASLDSPVSEVMTKNPTTALSSEPFSKIEALMRQKQLLQIPILDDDGVVVGLETIDSISEVKSIDCDVVLMAGGFGKRLYPLTKDTPKPMLKIGNKPLLEMIIERFVEQGFKNFHMPVHYKSEIIKSHFGDGSNFGAKINYVNEDKPLGTAGAVKLVGDNVSENFIVMNADIMTEINYEHLLEFHKQHNSHSTMCLREYEHTIPYGVVEMDGDNISKITEKPTSKHFVSAGIYVLNKAVCDYIPHDEYFDMPSLFEKLIADGKETCGFPIHEYWLDIGRMEDYNKIREDYGDEA